MSCLLLLVEKLHTKFFRNTFLLSFQLGSSVFHYAKTAIPLKNNKDTFFPGIERSKLHTCVCVHEFMLAISK